MIDVKVLASGSSGNCYRVSDGSTAILLDAGIPIKRIREGCGFELHAIEGCFVTHSHSDHCKAVKNLVWAGIPVYMTEGEKREYCRKAKCEESAIHDLTRDADCSNYRTVHCGTFVVKPFQVQHDTEEPVGFFLGSETTHERLLYFTDTFYLRQKFSPFDYLIGEVNYDEESLWEHVEGNETNTARAKRLFSSHMSLDTFLQFLRANDTSRLKKVWICHMSDDHGNEARIKKAVQQETGVEVEVC